MIAAVREWLTSVMTVALLVSLVQTLVPEGTMRKTASFTGGLLLLVALMQPMLGTDLGRLTFSLEHYEAAIEAHRQELEAKGVKELALGIETRTAAYISDKAEQMGLTVTARVETRLNEEGIPLPDTVELTGQREEELIYWIEQELGIPAERQVWYEDES